MTAHALCDSHGQTRRHPCLLLVIGAVQVPVHKHQALYQLERSRLPKNCVGTEKGPRAPKVAVSLCIPSLYKSGFLSLYCQGKNNIEHAGPDITVRVECYTRFRVRGLIVVEKAISIQDWLHRIDELPVYADKAVSVCARWQITSQVGETIWGIQVQVSKQGRIHKGDKV